MAESDFRKIKRILIERSIIFISNDQEQQFTIGGMPFTTQELIQLERENKLTNLDLPELLKRKRNT
jgi:hypothetical protein